MNVNALFAALLGLNAALHIRKLLKDLRPEHRPRAVVAMIVGAVVMYLVADLLT